MKLKLYRGVSADEFELLTPERLNSSRSIWADILTLRSKGVFSYPNELDREIQKLSYVARLERQHFTDNKKIAASYAKKSKGLLIEISVPIFEVLKNFRLEFQNFGLRKKKFEIVYVVSSTILVKRKKSWSLKVLKIR